MYILPKKMLHLRQTWTPLEIIRAGFLQDGYFSCHPSYSIRALKTTQNSDNNNEQKVCAADRLFAKNHLLDFDDLQNMVGTWLKLTGSYTLIYTSQQFSIHVLAIINACTVTFSNASSSATQ